MAKEQRTKLSSSDKKVEASWLKNAGRSLGVTGLNTLKSFAPNLYEVTTSATKTGRDVVKEIKQGKISVNTIHKNIKNNKYIKYADDAFKTALKQIKTGNLNDPDAADRAMMKNMGFDDLDSMFDDSGISFGDDGADNNVDVDVNVSDNNAGMFALSEQIRTQTELSLKTNQANLDAMIALNANTMMQNQKTSTEIISGLNAINQNLASLVEYNNSSMSKFIESSMAYYEKMGSKIEDQSNYNDSTKVTAADVLRGNNGNINFSEYKKYVKSSFKKTIKETDIGQLASFITDDFIEMIISNPVGAIADALSAYIVPTTIQKTIKATEAKFNAVVPKMLHQLADWGDNETGIKKYVGKVFGVSIKRQDTFDKGTKIEKGAVPFDGITRHTINEILTKELSEQTAYLKTLVDHSNEQLEYSKAITKRQIGSKKYQKLERKIQSGGQLSDRVKNQAEVFDFESGNYTTVNDLQEQLRNDIQNNINWAFKNSPLGKEINSRFMKSDDSDDTKKEKERFLSFISLLDERNSGRYIDLGSEAHTNLINQASSASNTSDAIRNEFKQMIQDLIADPEMKAIKDSYHSLVYEESRARNERLKYYEQNPYETHLYRMGNIKSIDEFMGVKNGNVSGNGHLDRLTTPSVNTNTNGHVDTTFNHISNSIASTASGIVSGLAVGSLPQAFENIKSLVQHQVDTVFDYVKRKVLNPISEKLKNSFFGTIDENGVRNGGIFAGVLNSFSDATKTLKWHITGQEYTDSNGVRHEAKNQNETVVGTFKSIGHTIKDALTSKFSDLTDENTGIIPTIKSTLNEGIAGWQEAIFGKTLTEEERKDLTSSAIKTVNERLPSSMVGAVGGSFAGAGLLGSLIGGPVGGAILGSAVGFASKSEKFQKFVFGETDNEGNTLHEGIISKKVQNYIKDNKKELIGSGTIGAVTGAITGAGLLGSIVGGPVAGAILGVGTSVLKKSHMFNEFLFGDEARGQVGIIQSVKNIFGKYSKASDDNQKNLNKKVLGMGVLGAGSGAVTAAALSKLGVFGLAMAPGGPIGGALLGLGVSMLAQKDNFNKWLFGEKDENGKMKSAGLITQFGNMIKTSVFMPMKDSITNYLEDAAITIHYDILDNIRFGIQPILDKTLGLAKSISDKVTTMFTTMAKQIKDFFAPIVDVVDNFVVKPVRKLVSGVTNIVYKSVKFAVTMPFKIIGGIGTFLKNRVTDTMAAFKSAVIDNIITPVKKTVNDYIIDPIKKKVQGFFNKIFNGIRNVATNIAGAVSYLGDKWYNVGKDPRKFKDHTGEKDPTYYQQKKAAKENRKVEEQNLAQRRRERQIRTKNSEIIRKATGGMYTEDTEENRQRARMNDKYKDYKFDRIEALDVKWKREKQERDSRSTAGMSENNILNANISQLDPESQQVSLLSRILNVIKGKGDSQGYTHNDENQNPDDQNNNQQSGDNSNQSENNTQNNQQQDTTNQNNNQQSTDDSQNNTNPESKSDFKKEIEHRQAEIAAVGGLFKFWGNKYKNTKIHRFSKNIEEDLRNNIGWYGRLFDDSTNNQNNGGHGFANGTDNAEPGLALVGEGGTAELVDFNGGEKVYPSTHPKTQAYMSTVANATGTMGMDETHIIDSDLKKLDTQSQQVQILLRILAILKGKPGIRDTKDIENTIKENENKSTNKVEDKQSDESQESTGQESNEIKEKTRSEKFEEDINNVVDRIREAGGLRAYTMNAMRNSVSKMWNRTLLKRGIDTVSNVASGIGNIVGNTATSSIGLGKYLFNRGKETTTSLINHGKKTKKFFGELFFGKDSSENEENETEGTSIEDNNKLLSQIDEKNKEKKAQIENDKKARMAEAIDKGVTAKERQEELKAEKEASVLNSIRESTETQVVEQKGFTKLWSSIFSKKGLITGSLILAAPFIFKAIRKLKNGGLWSFITGGFKKIGTFLKEKVGPFFKEHIEPLILTGLETVGTTIGNIFETNLPNWISNIFGGGKSDNLTSGESDGSVTENKNGRKQFAVLDKNGNWDNQSGARLKLGTKVVATGATIVPGLSSTFMKNTSKYGLFKGIGKTAASIATHKGRKQLVKEGSDNLIKKGNRKFSDNIFKFINGKSAASTVTDTVQDIPIATNIVNDAGKNVAVNEIDESLLFFGETADDLVKKTGINAFKDSNRIVVDESAKLFGESTDDLLRSMGTKALINNSDDVGKAIIVNTVDDVTEEVAEKAIKNSSGDIIKNIGKGLKDKVIKYIGKFADDVIKLIEKKIGKKLTETGIGKIVSKVTQCVSKHFSKISSKVSAIIGAESGLAATGVGWLAKNGVFCTLSSINGISGTARLFQIDKENIDWVMTTISGALGFFNGTMVGSICDVVNELVVSMIGIDFYTSIASLAYKAIMALTGNRDKAEALNMSQDEFKNKYDQYINGEAQTSLATAKKLGLVDSNMSLEEYKTSYVQIGSDYKSFADYNDEQHKTIGSRVFGGLSKFGHKIVSPFLNEKTKIVTDSNGNTYVQNKDGTYTAKDSNGKEIGIVNATLVENLENTKTTDSTKLGLFGKYANSKPFKAIGNFNTKLGKGISHFFAAHNENAFKSSDGTYYTIDGEHYDELGTSLGDSISSDELQEMLNSGKLSKMDNLKVSSGYMNMGASIARGISDVGNGISDFFTNITDSLSKSALNTIESINKKITHINLKIANKIADFGNGIADVATNVKNKITDGLNGIKNIFTGNNKKKSINIFGGKGISKTQFNNIKVITGNILSKDISDNLKLSNKTKAVIKGYISADNSYYDLDGVHYNAHGDKLGGNLSKEQLNAQLTSGLLKETELPFGTNENIDIVKGSTNILKKFTSIFNTVQTDTSNVFNSIRESVKETFDDIESAIDVTSWKPASGKAYYDPRGNYYILTGGNRFNYCNTMGDVIGTATKTEVFNKLKSSILKEYTKPNRNSSVVNDIKSMKDAVSKAWSVAKNSGVSKWSAITKLLKGGKGFTSSNRIGNALGGYSFTNKDVGDTGMYDALSSFKEYTSTYRTTLNEGDYSSSIKKKTPVKSSSILKNNKITTNKNIIKSINNTTSEIKNTNSSNSKKSIFSTIGTKIKNKLFGGSGNRIYGGGYATEKIPVRTYEGSKTVYLAYTPSNAFRGDQNGKNYPENVVKEATDRIDKLARSRNSVRKNGYKKSDVDKFNKDVEEYEKWEQKTKNQYQFKDRTTGNYIKTAKYDNGARLILSVTKDDFPKDSDGYKKWNEYYAKLKDADKKGLTSEYNKYASLINNLTNKYDKNGKLKKGETDDDDDSGLTIESNSTSSSSKKSSSSSSGVSGSIFDILGSFFGEFASRASEGILTGEFNKDWSSFWGTGNNNDSTSDSTDDSDSSTSSLNIDGIDDLKIVQKFTTSNPMYNDSDRINVKGLTLHSVGCKQPDADAWREIYNGSPGALVHAFIDAKKDNYVVQCAPWDLHGAHICSPGNESYIGIEMGESDKLSNYSGATFTVDSENKDEVLADVKRAYITAVKLFAALCREFDLDPMGTNVIVSHCEVTKKGLSNTDHIDPEHYWDGTNSGFNMDKFRTDVNNLFKKIKKSGSNSKKSNDDGGNGNGKHSILNKNNLLKYLGGYGESFRTGDADDANIRIVQKMQENYEKHKEKINDNIKKHGSTLIKKFKKEDRLKKIGGNGVRYYSQNDSKWSNNAYGNDGSIMGDTGCGPTAMAMITSSLTGKSIKPPEMASLANSTGMRDETGTNSKFINVASSMYGIKSSRSDIPDSETIYNSAKNGPTLLLGQNESHKNNPFTDAGHYVVTDGVDSHGNIKIKDPRGSSYNKSYNANDLASTTSSMWEFGGNGTGKHRGTFGSNLLSKISKRIGGFGKKLRKIFGGRGNNKWMSIVKNVKKQLANKSVAYKSPPNVSVTIDNKTVDAMPDCSGYVCTCLIFYGVDVGTCNRGSMSPSILSDTNGFANKSGFKHTDFTGWDACSEGDIVGNSGHCEIFSHMDGNIPYVYNCGSTDSLKSETPVASSINPGYTYIWTPKKYDDDDDLNDNESKNNNESLSNDSSTSWKDLSTFERMNSWALELASRVSEGSLTGEFNNDWNSFWNNLNRIYDDNDEVESSTTTTTTNDNSKISGSDRYEKFWNFFTKNLGISKIGTAGFMGCYQAENEINPEHLEADFTSRARGTYADLTQKVKNALTNKKADELPGLYDEYMNKVVIPSYSIPLNLPAYKGKNGHYYPGMGFGSWTPSDDYVQYVWDNNLRWDSMEGSLKFFKYLYYDKYGSQFRDKIDMISNATSPESAAAMVMDNILMPGSSWSSSNSDMPRRSGLARDFYEKYGGSGIGKKHRKKLGGHGVPYYSQTDRKWSDDAYGNDGATMGDTGCGPTAMAMVTSSLTGEEVKPTEMASLANATGMRDETGTNAGFIDVAADTYGLNSRESFIPDSETIYNSAKNGPTVLLGQNESGTNNPFTDAGHYVVTDGVDSHGMINIKDPRGTNYNKKFKADDLANTTSSMWDFGGTGKNKKIKNNNLSRTKLVNKSKIKGGRGVNKDRVKWLSIVRTVKKMMADKKLSYNQGGWTKLTIDGVTNNVRQDCTGLIGGCLGFYDVLPLNSSVWTGIMMGPDSEMAKTGFKCKKFTSWKDLEPGDIVVNDVHGEIFSRMDGDTAYVYNAGSTESICRAGDEPDSSTYSWVWCPCNPGKNCVNANEDGSYNSMGNDDDASSTSTVSGFKNKTLGKITSWLSEFANRSIEGIIGGHFDSDWDSFWSGINDDITGNTDSDDEGSTLLSGSNTEEKIWNYFKKKGLSDAQVAGIMGNMQLESGFKTDAVNPSSGAYGLAQWLGVRKTNLQNFAKERGTDPNDLQTQLDFYWHELQSSESDAYEALKTAKTAEDAAIIVQNKFERGGDNSPQRAQSGKTIYDKYHKSNGGSGNRLNINKNGGFGSNKINNKNDEFLFNNFENPHGTGPTGGEEHPSIIEIKKYENIRKKSKNKNGGYGYGKAIVDNTDLLKKPKPPKTTNRDNIINNRNNTDMTKIMNTIVNLLESIAGNTNNTTEKLEYLRNSIKDMNFIAGNTTNNVITQGSSTNNSTNLLKSRNRVLAEKIARGI